MLQFEVKASGGPPAGFYRTRFITVEPTQHEEFGAGLKFVFEVTEGELKGQQASRITSSSPTPKNAAGRIVSGIIGEPLVAGQRIDLAPFVGREYLTQVETVPGGTSTRIATVMPAWNRGAV